MDINSLLDNVIFLNLLSLTIISWANLIYPNIKLLSTLNSYGTLCVNILIFTFLSLRWFNFGYFPLSNLYESLLFLAWGITFLTIVIEKRSKMQFVGALTIPITLFVVGFASLSLPENMQAPAPLVPALKSNWLMMHVTVMMLSYTSLIIGSLLSIFFLVLSKFKGRNTDLQGNAYGPALTNLQVETAFYSTEALDNTLLLDSAVTNPSQGNNDRLNMLESIDNLSYRTIGFGFPLLTIGLISGAVWANEAWGSYWSWDPKETWALITWLVFASYLHARLNKSWQGEKPAMIASFGFIIVWICYLGVNFLGKGLHTYGQFI